MKQVPDMKPVTVLEHHAFLVCDNRPNAVDNRIFAPVGITSLEGRLKSFCWPYSRRGPLTLNTPD